MNSKFENTEALKGTLQKFWSNFENKTSIDYSIDIMQKISLLSELTDSLYTDNIQMEERFIWIEPLIIKNLLKDRGRRRCPCAGAACACSRCSRGSTRPDGRRCRWRRSRRAARRHPSPSGAIR